MRYRYYSSIHHRRLFLRSLSFVLLAVIGVTVWWGGSQLSAHASDTADTTDTSNTSNTSNTADTHLITVYDRGEKTVFLTKAATLKEALKAENITVDTNDAVEPSLDEQLVAADYQVNIYRARPVTVVDGAVRTKVMTPYQVADRIVESAHITLNDEDTTTLTRSDDLVGDGAGLELTIHRATPLQLDLYGKTSTVRTQGKTVKELLEEKNITLGANDRTSPSLDTEITENMHVRVWREGKQTITSEETIPFDTEIVYDADRPIGYRETQTAGVAGVQTVTYEIEIQDGVEVSRTEIARLTTQEPSNQVDVIGVQNNGTGLTKSKGAQYYTDSKGVTHRETYYDLNMHVVMQACGQGGNYTVRSDGAKVDADGYIIIAANYSRYPRCSVVETSLGLGKVYDTGGFATRYPDGFDLATDWSSADGI